ncbi:hypothetical protein [Microbacterium sp. NPDC056569]|uniref:hypothetical protein n=1 Tax=Microbacterium sp. NPDC056569 TaxID=3345867 RepID=UPI00366EA1AE
MTAATVATPVSASLVGAYVPEIISLAKRGLLWAFLYGVLTLASRGGCLDPASGGDPVCYTATLRPSPLTWFVMALVFVVALSRAAKATSTAQISRILSLAATALWVVPLLAAVLGVVSFMSSGPEAWLDGGVPVNIDFQITPG